MTRKTTSLAALAALCTALAASPAWAQAQPSAETLLASKQAVDMSYRELMQILQRALGMMQDGILLHNKQLVTQGAQIILHHPAPRTAPWLIMPKADQDGFKQALLTYDKQLDLSATAASAAAAKADWFESSAKLAELQTACLACHASWRGKARP